MRPLLRQIARALLAVLAASPLLLGLTACGGGGDAEHGYSAEFSRAVQVFPAKQEDLPNPDAVVQRGRY